MNPVFARLARAAFAACSLAFAHAPAAANEQKPPQAAAVPNQVPAHAPTAAAAQNDDAKASQKPAIDPAVGPAIKPLRHGAPAKAQDGTDVVWDNVGGLFVVRKKPDTFWIGKRFFSHDNGIWTAAPALAGPWELIPDHLVPDVAREHFLAPKTSVTARLPSGSEAVFDPRLRVYRVAGKRGVFVFNGAFFRYDNGIWLESDKEEGAWKPTSSRNVPGGLRASVPTPADGEKAQLPSGDVVSYVAQGNYFTLDGKPSVIYTEGMFYEQRDRKWFASLQAKEGFAEVTPGKVPVNVRQKDREGGEARRKKLEEKKALAEEKRKLAAQKRKEDGKPAKTPSGRNKPKPAADATAKPAADTTAKPAADTAE